MKNKITFLTILGLLFSSIVFASQLENRAMKKGLRPMSMGGAFTAIADDDNAFFYNPAGITYRNSFLIQPFSLDIAISTAIIDSYNFYTNHKSDMLHFVDKLDDEQQIKLIKKISDQVLDFYPYVFVSIPNILFITKPIAIKKNYLNFGFGVFSYAKTNVNFNRGAPIPSVSHDSEMTVLGILPVAFKIRSLEKIRMPGALSLGANFKYMCRLKNVSQDKISLRELPKYDLKEKFFHGTSFGVDFGAIYHLNSHWNFGLMIAGVYNSSVEYKNLRGNSNKMDSASGYNARINTELNLGVAYYPEKFYYWPGKYLKTNDRLALVFDLTDLANSNETFIETPFKKTHIGAEYKYNSFVIRAGCNSGYPTIGGGIVTNCSTLEYAFYGEEKGLYAGQNPVWVHRILFSVKIGHNKEKI
ncbi:MAG: hypothetical protein LE180_03325 [Endomicrobium sp.]|uniref:conjugal transfer protein TraF n=1 Tax=Candidatus Endomicrobiellum pyrsonymphae TaxID=1408203 RepID=UPI0035865BC5|nr:hypothetical protein [Endomicrobium sp.]